MYQNKHGRFTAVDPLLASTSAGNPQTFNRYTYTGNNPVNYTDPLGLKWCRDPSGGAVSWANGNCPDGQKVIDGTVGETKNTGCAVGITTSCYSAGSVIGYNRDGTTSLVRGGRQLDPYNEKDAAQIAKLSGTEVQAEQNETAVANASEIVSPMATLISYRPLESMTRQEFDHGADRMQMIADTVGFLPVVGEPADAISGFMSAGRGDYFGAVLSLCALNPVGGQVCGGAKLGRRLGQGVDTVGNLRKAGKTDAHHIIQDATVSHLPGYNSSSAPGIQLPGGGRRGTPHYRANMVQRQKGGGTYAAERRIGYKAMRRAGVEKMDARNAINEADAYFTSIGVGGSTTTRIPRRNRR